MAFTTGPTRGIALMLLGTLLLTGQDAVSKWLIHQFSVGEILVYRGLWAYLPLAWFAYREGGWSTLRSKRPIANCLRAALNTGAGFAVITAYAYMPLADAIAIMFASPIIVTALSAPMLGESVGWRRWSAVILGFLGVLIMLRPGGTFDTIALLPVAAACFIAVRDILTRRLGHVDSATTILFYTITVSVLGGLATFPFVSLRPPDPGEWLIFAALGLVNGIAHYCTISAFKFARAATLAPLRYFGLIWAGAIGFMVWGDIPDAAMIIGSVLVVASGVFIILREAQPPARTP
ncbi:MAG: DMT family transporter [Pseudomonadota bacterium]